MNTNVYVIARIECSSIDRKVAFDADPGNNVGGATTGMWISKTIGLVVLGASFLPSVLTAEMNRPEGSYQKS